MSFKCKECGKEFSTKTELHKHFKDHNLLVAEYYTKHYPKNDLWTGKPLPFKDYDSYFEKDFLTKQSLNRWCKQKAHTQEGKDYIIKLLKNYKKTKKTKLPPSFVELLTSFFPKTEIIQEAFGSYGKACFQAGFKKQRFTDKLPQNFCGKISLRNPIIIDTREQKPFSFKKSISQKLEYGDYGLHSHKVTIERKAVEDFVQTLGKYNVERFKREIDRCVVDGGYIFVVVEKPIEKIESQFRWISKRFKMSLPHLWHTMRELMREYPSNIQFIFAKDKEHAKELTEKILHFGDELRNVDLQYYIHHGLDRGNPTSSKE